MKRTEIDARFTQEVGKYIGMGYTISTETMRGSQREIAKVDLVKDNDFIRILLDTYIDHDICMDKIVLSVGRIPEEKRANGWTVWNNDMEVYFTEEWYKLDDRNDYYTTPEKAEDAHAKQLARWEANREDDTTDFDLSKAAAIVKPFVNRQKGCKSTKLANIKRVYKTIDRKGKATYRIETKAHRFVLA